MQALYGKQAVKPTIRKEIARERARQYQELQDNIQTDIAAQLTAAVLYTLNVCEGFGAKRLKRFFAELNGTFEDMSGVGFAGEFDCDDLTELVRERFGIDLRAEVKCKQSAARGAPK